jgi:hypothetical protein
MCFLQRLRNYLKLCLFLWITMIFPFWREKSWRSLCSTYVSQGWILEQNHWMLVISFCARHKCWLLLHLRHYHWLRRMQNWIIMRILIYHFNFKASNHLGLFPWLRVILRLLWERRWNFVFKPRHMTFACFLFFFRNKPLIYEFTILPLSVLPVAKI